MSESIQDPRGIEEALVTATVELCAAYGLPYPGAIDADCIVNKGNELTAYVTLDTWDDGSYLMFSLRLMESGGERYWEVFGAISLVFGKEVPRGWRSSHNLVFVHRVDEKYVFTSEHFER